MTSRMENRCFPSKLYLACSALYIISIVSQSCGYISEDSPRERSASLDGDRLGGQALSKKGNGGMWFGPRLGKRGPPAPLRRLLMEALADPRALEDLPDFVGNSYEMTGTKRRFTPRLGRESGEMEARHVEFVPRLGRELALSFPSSSLSSDNDVASIPLLYGRYASEDRLPLFAESGVPPFAPRLGRELVDFYNAIGLPMKDFNNRNTRSVLYNNSKSNKESTMPDNDEKPTKTT